jgi:transposase
MKKSDRPTYLGIDVSKGSLDCCLYNGTEHKTRSFNSNKLSTVQKIITHFKISPDSCRVVLEATGVYHSAAFIGFTSQGFDVAVENPLRIRSFAMMKTLLRTKTDPVDARTIAEYGFINKPAPTKPKEAYQYKVMANLKLIGFFKKLIAQNLNYIEALNNNSFECNTPSLITHVKNEINHLNVTIKEIKREIEKILTRNCPELYKQYKSIPGIGPAVAGAIICFYGDFSGFSDSKKAAAFAGICPKVCTSGTSVDKRGGISKKGNSMLRTLFYMAALSAARCNDACHEAYLRLRQAGKPAKVALIAIANKLLRQAMALARKGESFTENYKEISLCRAKTT